MPPERPDIDPLAAQRGYRVRVYAPPRERGCCGRGTAASPSARRWRGRPCARPGRPESRGRSHSGSCRCRVGRAGRRWTWRRRKSAIPRCTTSSRSRSGAWAKSNSSRVPMYTTSTAWSVGSSLSSSTSGLGVGERHRANGQRRTRAARDPARVAHCSRRLEAVGRRSMQARSWSASSVRRLNAAVHPAASLPHGMQRARPFGSSDGGGGARVGGSCVTSL
jgi:hypothetical protein